MSIIPPPRPAQLLFIFILQSSHHDLPIGSVGTNTSGLTHTKTHTRTHVSCPVPCLSWLFVYWYDLYFWEIFWPEGLNYHRLHTMSVLLFLAYVIRRMVHIHSVTSLIMHLFPNVSIILILIYFNFCLYILINSM